MERNHGFISCTAQPISETGLAKWHANKEEPGSMNRNGDLLIKTRPIGMKK